MKISGERIFFLNDKVEVRSFFWDESDREVGFSLTTVILYYTADMLTMIQRTALADATCIADYLHAECLLGIFR